MFKNPFLLSLASLSLTACVTKTPEPTAWEVCETKCAAQGLKCGGLATHVLIPQMPPLLVEVKEKESMCLPK
jgi:hypothetical protein